MRDPRALASIRNYDSYRAWRQEGVRKSGFIGIISILMGITPLFTVAVTLFRPATRAHAYLISIGAAFALYLVVAVGLMLFAVLQLNAWKRAHPWEPPPSPVWK
jgi:hypothetical protein